MKCPYGATRTYIPRRCQLWAHACFVIAGHEASKDHLDCIDGMDIMCKSRMKGIKSGNIRLRKRVGLFGRRCLDQRLRLVSIVTSEEATGCQCWKGEKTEGDKEQPYHRVFDRHI